MGEPASHALCDLEGASNHASRVMPAHRVLAHARVVYAEEQAPADPPTHPSGHPPWWSVVGVAVLAAGLYVGLPRLVGGFDGVWGRLSSGEPLWLCAAALFEVASYACYVWMFHRVFTDPGSRIGWRESYDISLAGVAASRLIATAGAGGIALTAWALRRSGMDRRELASRLTTFYVALYAVYMASLVVFGIGLRTGVMEGRAPFGLTVVPALFAGVAIAAARAGARFAGERSARLATRLREHGRAGRWLATVVGWADTVAAGVQGALRLLRARDPALLAALGWWGFDICTLWACFHAFGATPPAAVVVMGYFTGMLGNVLPTPAGLGGVEGGMIAAFMGFGVESGVAVAAVLSYRAFAYWMPLIPGVLSYVRLLRTASDWEREDQLPSPAAS
jgi:putative heme transporter